MKTFKTVEKPRMNLSPSHRLSNEEMCNVQGGAGCICNKKTFRLNGDCVCDKKKFGICNHVKGVHETITYSTLEEEL